jgi:hypothetical protein
VIITAGALELALATLRNNRIQKAFGSILKREDGT